MESTEVYGTSVPYVPMPVFAASASLERGGRGLSAEDVLRAAGLTSRPKQLVHRGLRRRRPERCESAARRIASIGYVARGLFSDRGLRVTLDRKR
jgi:hypothetical protein